MLGFVNQTLYFFEGAIFSRHEEILIIALLFLPPLLDGPRILLADSYNRSIWGIQDIQGDKVEGLIMEFEEMILISHIIDLLILDIYIDILLIIVLQLAHIEILEHILVI